MDIRFEKEWFEWKKGICDKIYSINETEAKIILCCIISRFSAALWPGYKIDEKRFTQTLIDFTPKVFNIDRISIPMLELNLEENGESALAAQLVGKFDAGRSPNGINEVLSGSQIDKSESEILNNIPNLPKKVLRKSSYAGTIYTQLRCYLMHEFTTSPKMDNYNMSRNEKEPSYVNISKFNENGMVFSKNKRKMYLPYKYFYYVVNQTIGEIFRYWEAASEYKKPRPAVWWIEGK